jgi:pyruvate/2-oxoglutarate dehydrogenase complex dihydrolipoamide dehydrogenase (E3) component
VPSRLAVVGAGGVGVELATAWNGLGASVTLLARGSGLLPRMEPFVGEFVERGLRESGVAVRVGVSVTTLHRPSAHGPVTLELSDGSKLEVDEVLFATGRAPLTDDIGLETVGLAPGSWLDVDDTCRVQAVGGDWLYAAGDANHRAPRRGRQANRWTPRRGAPMPPPPTITRCRRFSSPSPKPPRSGCRPNRPSRLVTAFTR